MNLKFRNLKKYAAIGGGSLLVSGGAFAQAATDYATQGVTALAGLNGVFGTVYGATITIMGSIVLGMVAWKYVKKLGNKV